MRGGSRGQVLPLFAMAAFALFGMGALAVDVGYWKYQQRIEQSTADSAAVAGAIELIYKPASQPDAQTFARLDAGTNGFTDDGGTTTNVTVNTPPTSGAYAGNAHAVEVIVQKKQPLFFGRIDPVFGGTFEWVSARAVARNDAPGPDSSCIVSLPGPGGNPTGIVTLHGGGGGGILAPNCGIAANGGWVDTGNGTVTTQYIDVPASSSLRCGGCNVTPVRGPFQPDPCATITSCNYLLTNPPTGTARTVSGSVLLPGEYASTVSISGDVTLTAGLYIFDNGLSTSGNHVITATAGVTIYNKGGSFDMSGNTSIDLIPPSTATCLSGSTCNYKGVGFFQPSTNTNPVVINGKAGVDAFDAMIYAPRADVTLNGNIPTVSELVIGSITINGSGLNVNNTSAVGGALGIAHVVLAE
jgi:Flp pilus assembly protein TadG